MLVILHSLGMFVLDLFRSRCRLEAENMFLRHQLSVALRRAPPRLRLCGGDRALVVWMIRLWPSLLGVAKVVQPETVLRWHRAGFKAFWRWKSRKRAGRPKIDRGLRDLIQRMSKENPQWGASRIHGELLMLGFEGAQSTVSIYMVRGGRPPSACPKLLSKLFTHNAWSKKARSGHFAIRAIPKKRQSGLNRWAAARCRVGAIVFKWA